MERKSQDYPCGVIESQERVTGFEEGREEELEVMRFMVLSE